VHLLDAHPTSKEQAALEMLNATHRFATLFLESFGGSQVTPYIHILVCHGHELVERFGDLNIRNQQGFEHLQKEQKDAYRTSTSRGGGRSQSSSLNLQIMERCFRARWYKNEDFVEGVIVDELEIDLADDPEDLTFNTPATTTYDDDDDSVGMMSEEEIDDLADVVLEDLSDDEENEDHQDEKINEDDEESVV
jgi:hypothetical protein